MTGLFQDDVLQYNELINYRWVTGSVFQGWFRDGRPHKGTVTWSDGRQTEI
jgi:hypothetical protein